MMSSHLDTANTLLAAEPVAAIWGLGEADPLLLGVVALSVLAFGVVYLVIRLQKKS